MVGARRWGWNLREAFRIQTKNPNQYVLVIGNQNRLLICCFFLSSEILKRNTLDCRTGSGWKHIVDGWISSILDPWCGYIAFVQVSPLNTSVSIPLLPLVLPFLWLLWFSFSGIFQRTKYRTNQHLSWRKVKLASPAYQAHHYPKSLPKDGFLEECTLDVGVESGWYPFWNLKVPWNPTDQTPFAKYHVNYDVTSPLRWWCSSGILPK